jgi:formylglycine-generating enzyme required for sulfatase activity
MKFAWVPPGEFLMGGPKGERVRSRSETQRHVKMASGFYLGVYPVTQAQWTAVMGTNPSRFRGDDHPAAGLSWRACLKYCQKLGANLGKRFRLPTEAEWEYACRAGTTTPFYFGKTISPEQANYGSNKTTRVGMFPPNAWGLFDMHGNVWEWCSVYKPGGDNDVHEPPPPEAKIEPARRGGAWCEPAQQLRSASRLSGDVPNPGTTGCRLVLCSA